MSSYGRLCALYVCILLWTRYGIQCFSQQRAVTWHVFGGALRNGLGRLSVLFESPLTGSSFTCTLLGRSTSWPRNWSDPLTHQITAAPDRFCWTRNVVSGQFKYTCLLATYNCLRTQNILRFRYVLYYSLHILVVLQVTVYVLLE